MVFLKGLFSGFSFLLSKGNPLKYYAFTYALIKHMTQVIDLVRHDDKNSYGLRKLMRDADVAT